MNPTEAKQEADRQIAVQQAARDGKRIEKKHPGVTALWIDKHPNEPWDWRVYDFRIAADSHKPQWPTDAPRWAQWASINKRGEVFFHPTRPQFSSQDDSLIQRPQVQPEPRKERCTICGSLTDDWVDPDWAKGRICRGCESDHEPVEEKPEPKQAREWWLYEHSNGHLVAGGISQPHGIHVREVLPVRMTFNQHAKSKGLSDISPHDLSILTAAHEAWDASAANGAQIDIFNATFQDIETGKKTKVIELLQQREDLARERDGWKVQCDQLTRERDEAGAEVERVRNEIEGVIELAITPIEKARDEAIAARATASNTAAYQAERAQQFEKERDKLRAELEADATTIQEYETALRNICLLCDFDPSDGEGTSGNEVYELVQSELSALKSQKGGSTIESMGGVEDADTHAKQLSDVALNDGTANPETLVRQAAIATASGTAVSPDSPYADTQRGTSAPPHASSSQPFDEGVPTREELKDLVWKTLRQSAYSCDSGTCQRIADAVRDRLACVGELSFEEFKKNTQIEYEPDKLAVDYAQAAFLAARATREPKGDGYLDRRWDASLSEARRERDTLRQQLAEETRRSLNTIENLKGQLSDAQAEVKRLAKFLSEENKVAVAARVEVKRLESRLEKYDVNRSLTQLEASQSTVERLRVAVERARNCCDNALSMFDMDGKAQMVASAKDLLDTTLDSITAPTDSVPTGLVEMCRDALMAFRTNGASLGFSHPHLAGYLHYSDEIWKQSLDAVTACQRHLSGEKPEQPVSKPHNPAGLTPDQVGVSDGWRLLDEDEIIDRLCPPGGVFREIEKWHDQKWTDGWLGDSSVSNYRTKLSRADLAAISKGETK